MAGADLELLVGAERGDQIDQTDLPRMVRELDAICDRFPLVGRR